MMRLPILMLALVFALLIPAPGCEKRGKAGPAFHAISYPEAIAKANREKKVVFIEFFADWCGPCRQLERTTLAEGRVREFLATRTVAIRVNIDHNPELAQRFRVSSIPCMVFVDGQGNEIDRIQGLVSAGPFLSEASRLVR